MATNRTRNMVFSALCVALGVVLPLAFHSIPNAGSIFLPMHIPVLLCGLVCGWPFGLACGILTPVISAIATGMPQVAYLPSMICELAVYGLISGLLRNFSPTGKRLGDIYVQLIIAMLAGRAVYGLMNALIFRAGDYSMQVFMTAAFVTSLPGIIIQLALLPAVVMLLEKAKLIQRATAV